MKRQGDGFQFYLTIAVALALAVLGLSALCHGQAFTAPAGQYRVENGRAVPVQQGLFGGSRGGSCPGGVCPQQPGWRAPQRPSPTYPVMPSSVHPAVCRISNQIGRHDNLGTGTLVDRNEKYGLVVTCQHLFREGVGTVTVNFPDGKRAEAKVVHVDGPWDLAALAIQPVTSAEPVNVSLVAPKPGETVWFAGYGPDGRYLRTAGRVHGYVRTERTSSNETLELTGAARQGDSGGPVFNAQGKLVAVLWGTDGRTVGGTYCGRVDKFLLTAGRYLLPWNAKIHDPARDPRNQPPPVVVPPHEYPPPVQLPPPVDLGPIQGQLQAQGEAIAGLDKRTTELERRADVVRDTAAELAKKYDAQLPGISKDVKAAVDASTAAAEAAKTAAGVASGADAKAVESAALAKGAGEAAGAASGKAEEAITEAKDVKGRLATFLAEGGGPIKQRIQERLEERGMSTAVAGALSALGVGMVMTIVLVLVVVLVRRGEKAAMAGDPTFFQRFAERTPWGWDDKLADVEARVLKRVGERLHPSWAPPGATGTQPPPTGT